MFWGLPSAAPPGPRTAGRGSPHFAAWVLRPAPRHGRATPGWARRPARLPSFSSSSSPPGTVRYFDHNRSLQKSQAQQEQLGQESSYRGSA